MILALIAAPTVLLIGFQNCSDMKASLPLSSVSFRLGMNGEKITGYEPTSMYSGGGTLVVKGENFTESTNIKIAGADCLDKQYISPNEIRCRAPALALGVKSVEIAGAPMPVPLTYVDFSKVNSVAGRNGMPGHLDGVARLARMEQIGAMTSDGETMYFTEYYGGLVRSMDLNTFEVKTLAGITQNYPDLVDGIGTAAHFNYPEGVAVKDGFLYIADHENCAIRKLNLATNEVTTLIGGPTPCEVLDGAGGVATLGKPSELLIDGDFLYVADRSASGNTVIRRLDLRDLSMSSLAGGVNNDADYINLDSYWAPRISALDGKRTLATVVESPHPTAESDEYEFTISQPGAVGMRLHFTELNLDGEYYPLEFADANGHTMLSLYGNHGTDYWTPVLPSDTVVVSSYIYYGGTYGFAIDKIEYVMDAKVERVHSLDGPGTEVALAGLGALLKVGNDLYFTDSNLNLVRKLNLSTGQVTGVTGGNDDGSRAVGKYSETAFSGAFGLAADSRYLYIADLGDGPRPQRTGERILRMDLVTRESTVLLQSDPAAGNPANIDGPLANAAVMQPRNLLYDAKRGLFFDCFDVIRRVK
jgi:hypothetical protein